MAGWRWEVIFEDSKGVQKALVSDEDYPSRALAFSQYMVDCMDITMTLKHLDCKLIIAEMIVYDNEDVFEEE